MKNFKQAISYLTGAIKLSNSFDYFTSRGFAYSEIGEYEKAKNDFDTIIEHAENTYFNTHKIAYAYNNLGYVEFKLGNIKSALIYIDKSLSLLPENAYAYRNKALVLLETNQRTDACEALYQAKSLKFTDNYGNEVDNLILKHCK